MGDAQFHAFQHLSGKWHWRLMTRDGETIASSGESFDSYGAAIAAAETVKRSAPGAPISHEPVGSVREVFRVIAHRNARGGAGVVSVR
jgi:uncharacterized protein YegP (UPF0339 family)